MKLDFMDDRSTDSSRKRKRKSDSDDDTTHQSAPKTLRAETVKETFNLSQLGASKASPSSKQPQSIAAIMAEAQEPPSEPNDAISVDEDTAELPADAAVDVSHGFEAPTAINIASKYLPALHNWQLLSSSQLRLEEFARDLRGALTKYSDEVRCYPFAFLPLSKVAETWVQLSSVKLVLSTLVMKLQNSCQYFLSHRANAKVFAFRPTKATASIYDAHTESVVEGFDISLVSCFVMELFLWWTVQDNSAEVSLADVTVHVDEVVRQLITRLLADDEAREAGGSPALDDNDPKSASFRCKTYLKMASFVASFYVFFVPNMASLTSAFRSSVREAGLAIMNVLHKLPLRAPSIKERATVERLNQLIRAKRREALVSLCYFYWRELCLSAARTTDSDANYEAELIDAGKALVACCLDDYQAPLTAPKEIAERDETVQFLSDLGQYLYSFDSTGPASTRKDAMRNSGILLLKGAARLENASAMWALGWHHYSQYKASSPSSAIGWHHLQEAATILQPIVGKFSAEATWTWIYCSFHSLCYEHEQRHRTNTAASQSDEESWIYTLKEYIVHLHRLWSNVSSMSATPTAATTSTSALHFKAFGADTSAASLKLRVLLLHAEVMLCPVWPASPGGEEDPMLAFSARAKSNVLNPSHPEFLNSITFPWAKRSTDAARLLQSGVNMGSLQAKLQMALLLKKKELRPDALKLVRALIPTLPTSLVEAKNRWSLFASGAPLADAEATTSVLETAEEKLWARFQALVALTQWLQAPEFRQYVKSSPYGACFLAYYVTIFYRVHDPRIFQPSSAVAVEYYHGSNDVKRQVRAAVQMAYGYLVACLCVGSDNGMSVEQNVRIAWFFYRCGQITLQALGNGRSSVTLATPGAGPAIESWVPERAHSWLGAFIEEVCDSPLEEPAAIYDKFGPAIDAFESRAIAKLTTPL